MEMLVIITIRDGKRLVFLIFDKIFMTYVVSPLILAHFEDIKVISRGMSPLTNSRKAAIYLSGSILLYKHVLSRHVSFGVLEFVWGKSCGI